jgi:2-polyprenyl-3-methyl-5-hydroxy-6-metoxy-1,4-benzoquinol methylase
LVETKQAVQAYWDNRPCGEGLTHARRGTHEYFAEIEDAKNRLEPYVHSFAGFAGARGLDVLEIGCGVGTDTVRFARAGARITAVDLSETAVTLTAERLAEEQLEGTVREADAESLPFADDSFDVVYSWGVLHHTPNTAGAIGEVARVLRPSGEARIMLYNSRSFFAAGVWARGIVRSRRPISPKRALATSLESPGTKAYSTAEVRALFRPLATIEISTVSTPYDRRVAGPLAGAIPALGWNHLVRARP